MKLFTIGDSISQGFMSGAAARTDLCYSTLIARSMQISGYKYPNNWGAGGLPVNLENILRRLSKRYASDINGLDWVTLVPYLDSLLDQAEDYYEGRTRGDSGDYTVPDPSGAISFPNVAVQGFDVADAWIVTPKVCREEIERSNDKRENRDGLFSVPNATFYRTALKVLNPSLDPQFDEFNQLKWLEWHAQQEGVENVALWLGGNNALGTVIGLTINQTPNDRSLLNMTREQREQWNLWHPEDFAAEYQELLDRVDRIMQHNTHQDWHVFVGTVPLVTIPPLSKGVGPTTTIEVDLDFERVVNDNRTPKGDTEKTTKGDTEKTTKGDAVYYKYYTYFFRDEEAVVQSDRAYLTLSDVVHIDDCIRQYNHTIKNLVAIKNQQYSQDRYHIVDTSKALQEIAFKRNAGQVQYDFPDYFKFVYPTVNTKYYHADFQGRLRQGGLFSLDGIHPSAICQGLIAYEFLKVMQKAGAVQDINLDWQQIFASDTLYSAPIPIMHELYENKKLAEFLVDMFTKGHSNQKK